MKLLSHLMILLIVALLLVELDAAPRKKGSKAKSKSKRKKINCKMSEMEKCSDDLRKFSNESTSAILTTEKGLDDVCTQSLGSTSCMKKYVRNCGTQLHQELFDFTLEQFTKSIDRFCKPGKLRTEFLAQSPCMHEKALSTPEYRGQCVEPYLATLERVDKLDDGDDRLDTTCCAYLRWKSCVYMKIDAGCGEPGRKAMDQFVDGAFGDLAKHVCNDASFNATSERCMSLYEKEGVKSSGSASSNAIIRMIALYFGFLFNEKDAVAAATTPAAP